MKNFIKFLAGAWQGGHQPVNNVEDSLKKSGWYPGRVCAKAVEEFEQSFGSNFHIEAKNFVSSYGNLTLRKCLGVYCDSVDYRPHPFKEMNKALLCQACPIANSVYKSCESFLWIDETGKFYIVDELEVWFIASTAIKAFEVLFFKHAPESESSFSLEQDA